MNIHLDVRFIILGYQKFQIDLINGSNGFIGRLGRLESRRLYRSVANMSNSVLTHTASADMVGHGLISLMRRCLFL